MLRGFRLLEVRRTADGYEVRVPVEQHAYSDYAPDELGDDFRHLAEFASGGVRVDLTALRWVTAQTAGHLVRLWRRLRDRGRLVVITSADSAFYYQITRLNRLIEVWAVNPDRMLVRV